MNRPFVVWKLPFPSIMHHHELLISETWEAGGDGWDDFDFDDGFKSTPAWPTVLHFVWPAIRELRAFLSSQLRWRMHLFRMLLLWRLHQLLHWLEVTEYHRESMDSWADFSRWFSLRFLILVHFKSWCTVWYVQYLDLPFGWRLVSGRPSDPIREQWRIP